MSGKGSRRRPEAVSRDAVADAWARTFGGGGESGAHEARRLTVTVSRREIATEPMPCIDLTVDGPMPHGDAQLRDAA